MRIAISRIGRTEHLAIERADGSTARATIPQKGAISHDLVHFCVEDTLGLTRGFWGSVAAGEEPELIQERAKASGHASAKRADVPDDGLVELLQAERLVECFEAESWSGGNDDEGLMAMARAGWAASHVPPLALDSAQLAAIRRQLADLGDKWKATPEGEAMELQWDR
ncbi:hypothetical protein K3172_13435 [Qipengyuania sp. 6B39]|uniref:hypothetical protein n=1 Tax=Qipengyuania proteolytica TaxID=2867239 RepID=UPI001C893438|nr:hypothetical protein [Qipengyuania proteolytica]MBX7496859.1 hypothetical protein [Qipengyuania proteolytica]